jgi:nicotinamide-nucleotide amidase
VPAEPRSAHNDAGLARLALRTGRALKRAGLMLVTAESCTGGWVAKALTDIPGSSQWLEGGYVTYSNAAKRRDLGVRPRTLERHGAVSGQTVREMARGALRVSEAHIAIAVSGIAGPDGGLPGKPVGTVWFAVARRGERPVSAHRLFRGDREAIRRKSVELALRLVAAAAARGRIRR